MNERGQLREELAQLKLTSAAALADMQGLARSCLPLPPRSLLVGHRSSGPGPSEASTGPLSAVARPVQGRLVDQRGKGAVEAAAPAQQPAQHSASDPRRSGVAGALPETLKPSQQHALEQRAAAAEARAGDLTAVLKRERERATGAVTAAADREAAARGEAEKLRGALAAAEVRAGELKMAAASREAESRREAEHLRRARAAAEARTGELSTAVAEAAERETATEREAEQLRGALAAAEARAGELLTAAAEARELEGELRREAEELRGALAAAEARASGLQTALARAEAEAAAGTVSASLEARPSVSASGGADGGEEQHWESIEMPGAAPAVAELESELARLREQHASLAAAKAAAEARSAELAAEAARLAPAPAQGAGPGAAAPPGVDSGLGRVGGGPTAEVGALRAERDALAGALAAAEARAAELGAALERELFRVPADDGGAAIEAEAEVRPLACVSVDARCFCISFPVTPACRGYSMGIKALTAAVRQTAHLQARQADPSAVQLNHLDKAYVWYIVCLLDRRQRCGTRWRR